MKRGLSLALSFVFMCASVPSIGQEVPADVDPTESSSRVTFRKLIADPLIGEYFTALQQEILPTPFDTKIRNLYQSHPQTAELYQLLMDGQDAQLTKFINNATSSMIRARRFMSSDLSKRIHHSVVTLAKSMGFPQEAIENVQMFIGSGPKNAFTVSASLRRIVIVLYSDLIRTMSMGELLAVIGHELGHILLGHTTSGRMDYFMLTLLQSTFVQDQSNSGRVSLFLSEKFGALGCMNGCAINHSVSSAISAAESNSMAALMYQAKMKMELEANPIERNKLLIDWLNLILESMNDYVAPIKQIQFVTSLRDDLVEMNRNLTAGKPYYLRPADAGDFMQAATAISQAKSRSQEVSSDRMSDSTVRRYHLASAFIKLSALDSFDVADRPKLFQGVKEQADYLLGLDREELAENIGTTHPSSILRIYLMLNLPSYQSVVFANPFTRILALNQYIAMERSLTEYVLSTIPQTNLNERSMIEAHFNEVTGASDNIQNALLKLLSYRPFGAAKNPRLNDVIQYTLLQREQQLAQLAERERNIAATEKSGETEKANALKARLAVEKSVLMTANNPFIEKVMALAAMASENRELTIKDWIDGKPQNQIPPSSIGAEATAIKERRLAILKLALTSVSREEVKTGRLAFTTAEPGRNRWPEDPVAAMQHPAFVIPHSIVTDQPAEDSVQKSSAPRPRLMRIFKCEEMLSGRSS